MVLSSCSSEVRTRDVPGEVLARDVVVAKALSRFSSSQVSNSFWPVNNHRTNSEIFSSWFAPHLLVVLRIH